MKIVYIILFSAFPFFVLTQINNNKIVEFNNYVDGDNCNQAIEKGIEIINSFDDTYLNDTNYVITLDYVLGCLIDDGQEDKVNDILNLYNSNLTLEKINSNIPHLGHLKYFKGRNEFGKNDFIGSVENFQSAIEIFEKGFKKQIINNTIIKHYLYCLEYLSISHLRLGDFNNCITEGEKFLRRKNELSKDFEEDIWFKIYLAHSFSLIGDLNKAESLYKERILYCELKGMNNSKYYIHLSTLLAKTFFENGKYEESIDLGINNLKLVKKLNLLESDEHGEVLYNLANAYSELGRSEEAIDFYKRSFDLFKTKYNQDDIVILTVLNGIGSTLSEMGKFEEANDTLQDAIKMSMELSAGNTLSLVLRSNYSLNLVRMGENNLAEIQLKELIDDMIKYKQDSGHLYFMVLNNYAVVLSKLCRYPLSLDYYNKALKLEEEKNNIDTPNKALIWAGIGLNYFDQNKYNEGLKYLNKAKEIYINNGLENTFDFYTLDHNIALTLGSLDKQKEAISLLHEIIKKIKTKNGDKSPLLLGFMHSHALFLYQLGGYDESFSILKECEIIINESISKDDVIFNIYHLLHILYGERGDMVQSEIYLNKLLDFVEHYSEGHSKLIAAKNDQSSFLNDQGYYSEALQIALKNNVNISKNYFYNIDNAINNLELLSDIYGNLNSDSLALNYVIKSNDLAKEYYGEKSYIYLLSLYRLGLFYLYFDANISQSIFKSCLSLFEALKLDNQELFVVLSQDLACAYRLSGKFEDALKISKENLKDLKKKDSNSDLDLKNVYYSLAGIYHETGDFVRGKQMADEYLMLINKIYPDNSISKINAFYNLAEFAVKREDYFTSDTLFVESNSQLLSHYLSQSNFLTEKLRLNLKNDVEFGTLNLLNYCIQRDSVLTETLISGINNWFTINGISRNQSGTINQILTSENSGVSFELRKSHIEYNRLIESQDKANYVQLRLNMVMVEKKIDSLNQLVSEIMFKKGLKIFDKIEYKDICHKLKNNEVFIEILPIVNYTFDHNKYSKGYLFIILNSDSLDIVFLNTGKELEDIFYTEYSKSTFAKNIENSEIDKVSYKHFWEPIADKIGEFKTVYVSLGGVYNNINLNTLYNKETGKYLFEEKDITIVSNARDFVLNKEKEDLLYTSNTVCLFGFPDYNGNSTNSIDTINQLAFSRDLDPFWIDSLSRGGIKASLLPGTKIEVENISTTFKSKGWDVSTFLKDDATEISMKQVTSPRVIHIATHGYFFEDIPQDNADDRFMGMDKQKMVQDPLLRSGLLFAGANKTLQGEKMEGENGLLSAYEASMLNLKETELVVLSACETGRGEVKNGEGVYGLRKAFADAGAQNIIMSLWKVDDKVTQEFMTRFYENWLNDKTSIREAFKKTQLEIKAKYPQPYYWGAFILVGE